MANQVIVVTSPEELRGLIGEAVRSELGSLVREVVQPKNALNEKAAAAYLNYKVNTLRVWRSQSKGPAFIRTSENGGGIRYLIKDLDAWQASNRVFTVEAPGAPR